MQLVATEIQIRRCAAKISVEKTKELVEKKLNKLAYELAEESLESGCAWMIHQPKLTDEVKKALKKC